MADVVIQAMRAGAASPTTNIGSLISPSGFGPLERKRSPRKKNITNDDGLMATAPLHVASKLAAGMTAVVSIHQLAANAIFQGSLPLDCLVQEHIQSPEDTGKEPKILQDAIGKKAGKTAGKTEGNQTELYIRPLSDLPLQPAPRSPPPPGWLSGQPHADQRIIVATVWSAFVLFLSVLRA